MAEHRQGEHTHRPTGKTLYVEWQFTDQGAKAAWEYRARSGGRMVDANQGVISFDPKQTHASAAVWAHIRSVLDVREHHLSV